MTKKDYILIAEVISKEASTWVATSLGARAVDSVAHAFGERLEKENPKFNKEKFLTACNVK